MTNLEDLFQNEYVLPIVEPDEGAEESVLAAFGNILPGSVAVAIRRGETVAVYYEGGKYSRPIGREATEAERIEYAKIAAGRAAQRYPTIAFFGLQSPTGLKKVGEVDIRTWEVTFYPALSGSE